MEVANLASAEEGKVVRATKAHRWRACVRYFIASWLSSTVCVDFPLYGAASFVDRDQHERRWMQVLRGEG